MKPNRHTQHTKSDGGRRRKINSQSNTAISVIAQDAVIHFQEYHQINRFSKNLRTMLIEFLMYDGAIEANYLQDLLYDMQGLFELLEVIEQESEIKANQT